MFLKIDKVGCIKSAQIELSGLNIVTGPNESGKSTVGKTAYTAIKAIQESDTLFEKKLFKAIYDTCRNVFFDIQQHIKVQEKQELKKLIDFFERGVFEAPLLSFLRNKKIVELQQLLDSRISILNDFTTLQQPDRARIENILQSLRLKLDDFNDPRKKLKFALVSLYENIFKGQVNNSITHDIAHISIGVGDEEYLTYQVSNNADKFSFEDRLTINYFHPECSNRVFQDVTFFETPLILQAPLAFENEFLVPNYWTDLLIKLHKKPLLNDELSQYAKEITADISEIVGGDFIFNTDKNEFTFVRKANSKENNITKLDVNNMASGTKSFCILQQMAKLNLFSPSHLLIFDEPENHLHPAWQVTLAKILIKLVKNGIPILLTTHSSYFLEALRKYAKENGMWNKKVKCFFAQKEKPDSAFARINDVQTRDENEDVVFQSFYKAYEILDDDSSN